MARKILLLLAFVVACAVADPEPEPAHEYHSCPCPRIYQPLCASDGKTYNSQCIFDCIADQAKKRNIYMHVVRGGRC